MTTKSLFSRIIDGDLSADIVYQDDLCIAFRDINPQAPLHVLVVPRKPIEKLSAATAEDQAILGHLLLKAADIAKSLGHADAFRLTINNGAGAGQTVFHLHVHLLAGRSLGWPPG